MRGFVHFSSYSLCGCWRWSAVEVAKKRHHHCMHTCRDLEENACIYLHLTSLKSNTSCRMVEEDAAPYDYKN